MKLYERLEDLRIYAIIEVSRRGKMGIVMTGAHKNEMKSAFTRMCAGRTKRQSKLTFLVFAVFSPVESRDVL